MHRTPVDVDCKSGWNEFEIHHKYGTSMNGAQQLPSNAQQLSSLAKAENDHTTYISRHGQREGISIHPNADAGHGPRCDPVAYREPRSPPCRTSFRSLNCVAWVPVTGRSSSDMQILNPNEIVGSITARNSKTWLISTVRDPAFILAEDQFQWLLEEHAPKYPFDVKKMQAIAGSMDQYTESLVEQLNLDHIFDAIYKDFQLTDITVEVFERNSGSLFNAIHWELLTALSVREHSNPDCPLLVQRTIVPPTEDSCSTLGTITSWKAPSRSFNILLVVSRPRKQADIDPLLGAKALMAVLAELKSTGTGVPINLEMVRPGTWKAFETHITRKTEQWWQSGGRGPWFDVVHFDVHGIVFEGVGNVKFLSRSGKNTLLCSADQVAGVLNRCSISFVVLHACETAKTTTSVRSNFARTLVESGVESVIAMSFKLTGTAAEIFVRAFYLQFLSHARYDKTLALYAARCAMYKDAFRLGKLDQQVVIPDFFVPTMYTRSPSTKASVSIGSPISHTFEKAVKSGIGAKVAEPNGLLGREQDLLSLEWLLLREGHPNLALITGNAGIGKTGLVRYAANWWVNTNLIQDVKYWSFHSTTPAKVIRYLRLWDVSRPVWIPKKPRLFIIDHMEAVSARSSHPNRKLRAHEQQSFLELLEQYLNRRDLVILVSRSSELWCKVPESQVYRLQGLSNMHSIALASRIMKDIQWGSFPEDSAVADQLESLVARLNYNPACIEFFLRKAKSTTESARVRELIDPEQFGHSEKRPDNLPPSSPENLLQYMLLAAFDADGWMLPVVRQCLDHVIALDEGPSTKSHLILLSLCTHSCTFSEAWYEVAARVWSEDANTARIAPTVESIRNFVHDAFVEQGWAEYVTATDPQGRHYVQRDSQGHRVVQLNPMLTHSIRVVCANQSRPQLLNQIHLGFVTEAVCWAYPKQSLLRTAEAPQIRNDIRLNATSLLGAAALCYNITVLNNCVGFQPYHTHTLLLPLWAAALASTTPILRTSLLLPEVEQLLTLAERRVKAGHVDEAPDLHQQGLFGTNVDVVLHWCTLLSKHHQLKSTEQAVSYVMRLVSTVLQAAKSKHNWDWGDRRWTIAASMIHLSYCRLNQCHFEAATFAASVALRCYQPDESALSKARDILLRALGYYVLYSAALERVESKVDTGWYAAQAKSAYEDKKPVSGIDMSAIEPQFKLVKEIQYLQPDTDWKSWSRREMPNATAIRELVETGDVDEATTKLLSGLMTAQRTGNTTAQSHCRAELAELYMAMRDWTGAILHIRQLNQLRISTDRSPWSIELHYDTSETYDALYRYSRYGQVSLWLAALEEALYYFQVALDARGLLSSHIGEIPDEPDDYISDAMTIIRACLCILVGLPRCIITPREFNELDDLAQKLIIEKVVERWPDYDVEGKLAAQRLQRHFSLLKAPLVSQARDENIPGDYEVVGLTQMVAKLCRAEDGSLLAFFKKLIVFL